MFITHSYLGTTKGPYRCLFFLLLEDYVETQTQLVRELEPYLERFARRLGDAGALVRPFPGDIEQNRQHVLDKDWPHRELDEIRKTPSILMINEDFAAFDPQRHPWIQLNFRRMLDDRAPTLAVYKLGELLTQLAEAVADSDHDAFETAHDLVHDVDLSEASSVFQARPGIFGFSIDVVRGAELIAQLSRRLGGPHERR